MFSTNEREQFSACGLIKRENFLPPEKLTRARTLILQHLEQAGIRRNGEWHLADCPPSIASDDGMAIRDVKGSPRHMACRVVRCQ